MEGLNCLALLTDAFGGRGGIAQYNRDLVGALAAMPAVKGVEILPRVTQDSITLLPSGVRQQPAVAKRWRYAWRAWRAAATLRPGLIVCGHLYMAPLALVLAWRHRSRLVVQTHGIEVWVRPGRLQRRAVEAADVVLAVSRHTRAKVLDWAAIAPERVRVTPNTVADAYKPADNKAMRERLGLGARFAMLTVGRLDARERYKGQDRIIALLPELRAMGIDAVYLIAGEGDDRPRLQAMADRLGVAEHVVFLGQVSPSDLPDLYRAADAFVLASTGEGFGIVYLEAMACGLPALGLSAGGAPDALGDGFLGDVVQVKDLALSLAAVAKRRSDAGHLSQKVQDRFGRDAFRRRVALALSSILPMAVKAP